MKKHDGVPVLYLDFDGPLHHEDVWFKQEQPPFYRNPALGPMFKHVPLLERVLASLPEVRIVLSTSWVRKKGFHYARRRLSAPVRERVIGATFHTEMLVSDSFYSPYGSGGGYGMRGNQCAFDRLTRYQQIAGDVSRRGVEHWLAIDDDVDTWPIFMQEHLVSVDGVMGLAEAGKADELQSRLAQLCDLYRERKFTVDPEASAGAKVLRPAG